MAIPQPCMAAPMTYLKPQITTIKIMYYYFNMTYLVLEFPDNQ